MKRGHLPAFARPVSEDRTSGDQLDGNSTVAEQTGLTKCEYAAIAFKAALLQGFAARYGLDILDTEVFTLNVDSFVWAQADALLDGER